MHSHLPIRHLIHRVTESETPAGGSAIPDWLTELVVDLSALFEPFGSVARAGYECLYGDDRWEVSMFLGEIETVGGSQDGRQTPVNFRFDIQSLPLLFDEMETLYWNAFPNPHVWEADDRFESFLTISGLRNGQRVAVQVHAMAPEAAGPAMKSFADGEVELA